MKFAHVLCVPAEAIFPRDYFDETDLEDRMEQRKAPTLTAVDSYGSVWYFDQIASKWEPVG